MDLQSCVAGHHAGATEHAHDNKQAAGGPDKPFTDPVCGMAVRADPTKKAVHADRAYYFCSVNCMTKFRAYPQVYCDKVPAPGQASAHEGTIYTCPMHPEIRQYWPGITRARDLELIFSYATQPTTHCERAICEQRYP